MEWICEYRQTLLNTNTLLQESKTMKNSKPVIGKKIWLWSFMRASNCNNLTTKILVFWIDGHLWEVVAYEGCGPTWRFDCTNLLVYLHLKK